MTRSCTPLDLTRTAFKMQDAQCSRHKHVTLQHCCSANFHVQLVVNNSKVVNLSKVLISQLDRSTTHCHQPEKSENLLMKSSHFPVQAFNTGNMAKPDSKRWFIIMKALIFQSSILSKKKTKKQTNQNHKQPKDKNQTHQMFK